MRNTAGPGAAPQPEHRSETRLWWLALGFFGLVLLGTVADIDVRLSSAFYDPTAPRHWFLGREMPWRGLYLYGEYPTLLLAIGAAVVWGWSWRYQAWKCYRRDCALLALAVALGPGVLINGIVKPLWGRPRPQQTELFGGSRPYRHWWQPGTIGGGRSLPSGHASMGYVLVVGTCILSSHRPRWMCGVVFVVALTHGSLLGLARIIQGGHFVSDVLWAGCLMCCTVALLHRFLPASGSQPPMPRHEPGLAPV